MVLNKVQIMQPGVRAGLKGKPVGNKILLALPDKEFESIRPHLEFIQFPDHLNLHQPHRPVKFSYFPDTGLISLVIDMKDGKSVEAGLLGNDGASGISPILGLSRSPLREVVQISGHGFRIKVDPLKEVLRSAPRLQVLLHRYAIGLAMQVAQTAACNRLHKVEERLGRWLLIAQDRIDSAVVPITHDFLATMLGTDRPSVTLAATLLQKKGIIEYARGSVKIVNRKKLEDFACECYSVVVRYNRP